jgi:5-methylcytosine-specific restriction enzyme A
VPPGLRPCLEPRCPTLVPAGRKRCPAHASPAWSSHQPVTRIRGRRLQRVRARLFAEQPLCVMCLAQRPEVISLAVIRDHVIPLAEGGADDETNEQPLCQACSDAKSSREATRGRRRAW